jgi:hypothetical protein
MKNEAAMVYVSALTAHSKERQRTPLSIFSKDGDLRIQNLSRDASNNKCKHCTMTFDVMFTINMTVYLYNF